MLLSKEHKVQPEWACMIGITHVEHSSVESPGSEDSQQVNKCLLNPYYTLNDSFPNSAAFSIHFP